MVLAAPYGPSVPLRPARRDTSKGQGSDDKRRKCPFVQTVPWGHQGRGENDRFGRLDTLAADFPRFSDGSQIIYPALTDFLPAGVNFGSGFLTGTPHRF